MPEEYGTLAEVYEFLVPEPLLAARHGVELPAEVRRWEDLGDATYDAVFCVGNSLTHARDRHAALAGMARVLEPGGLLALTSRNWELLREQRPGLQVGDELVERDGRSALVIHAWTIPEASEDVHHLDIAVAALDPLAVHAERLAFWPFGHETLDADLRAAGLAPASSTYDPAVERYLVTARRD